MATITPTPARDEELAACRDLSGLYGRYAHRILAYISSRGVPSSALEDTVQEVWVRVHNGLAARPFEGHFSGWLFQIARNVIVDRARKPAPPHELPPDDPTADLDTPQAIL